MKRKNGKDWTVRFPLDLEDVLRKTAIERRVSKAEVVRQLVVEGLLSDTINEVQENFDGLLEKQREVSQISNSTMELHTRILINILSSVSQAVLLGRRGVSEIEISQIRKKSEEYVAKVRNVN